MKNTVSRVYYPILFDAINGTIFAAAWPHIAVCQCSFEYIVGSCGSEPIAVGNKRISAPFNERILDVSGNHWSQQIPIPIVTSYIFEWYVLNPPDSTGPGEK